MTVLFSGLILNCLCFLICNSFVSSVSILFCFVSVSMLLLVFIFSISSKILLISSGLSFSSTVIHSTSLALTVHTFLPLYSFRRCDVALCLIFADMNLTTVPFPRGGFCSMSLLVVTHIRSIPAYKHNAGSAFFLEPYSMSLSPHDVTILCLITFLIFWPVFRREIPTRSVPLLSGCVLVVVRRRLS